MPRDIKISITKRNNFDEIGQLIKKSPVLMKAIKANPALALIIAEVAQKVAEMDKFSEKEFEKIINSNPDLKLAAKNPQFKAELLKLLKTVAEGGIIKPTPTPSGGSTSPPDDGTADDSSDVSADELSLEILAYLSDIPIAHFGDIITSEHHNSLRRALYALADGVGNTVGKTLLTFAPILLPVSFEKKDNEHDWKIIFDKAVVPSTREQGGAGGSVSGAFVVQLPENFLIKGMIVRGKRANENADDPKKFEVSLARQEINKTNPKPADLITFDLREETGFFQKTETPKSTNLRVDNAKYQYFVTAFWQDEDDSTGFEIRAIQILCEP